MAERLVVNEEVAGSMPASPVNGCGAADRNGEMYFIPIAKWQMDDLRLAMSPRDRLPDESFSAYVKRTARKMVK